MTTSPPKLRMPAEWEPHAAMWIGWPVRERTWKDRTPLIAPIWAQMIRALAEGEDIRLMVRDLDQEVAVRAFLREHRADAPNIHYHHVSTNHIWMRDIAPTFVKSDDDETVILDWNFNAWGRKYPPWELEADAPRLIAAQTGLRRVQPGIVAEGGALDVNGTGTLIACEPTLIDEQRNPGKSREQIEGILAEHLGVQRVIWIPQGLVGDDTDGHIDNLARFISHDTVVTAWEPDPTDPNHEPTSRNIEALRAARLADGRGLNILMLRLPPGGVTHGEERLPANYCNFVIGNAAVIVPALGHPQLDREVCEILGAAFPGRRIVPLPAADVFVGGGCFHCATQQQPA